MLLGIDRVFIMESFIRLLTVIFIFGLGILLVGGFVFLFLGMITSCPLCGRRFAQIKFGSGTC